MITKFEDTFGSIDRVKVINSIPCCKCGFIPSQNAHTKSRAAGGTWQDIVPLCFDCHDLLHRLGLQTFQSKFNINLIGLAHKFAVEIKP